MVEIERTTTETFGIDDIPDVQSMGATIRSVFNDCRQSLTGPVVIDDIIIFGSVARGTAKVGTSDVDILLVLSNPEGDELERRFDMDEIVLKQCMEHSKSLFAQGIEHLVGGVDVETVKKVNKYNRLERIVTPRPSDKRGGPDKVFSIEENRFIGTDEIYEEAENRRVT